MSHKEHVKKIKASICYYDQVWVETQTNLFKSFVRSKQEYAIVSIADMGCGVNQTLEIAQAGALRRCIGVPPGTSKHEIFVLAGVMPPIFRAKLLTAKESFKLKAQSPLLFRSSPAETSYTNTIKDNTKLRDLFYVSNKICVNEKVLGKSKNEYSFEELRAFYGEIFEKHIGNGWNIISTDASIGPVSSGIGIL